MFKCESKESLNGFVLNNNIHCKLKKQTKPMLVRRCGLHLQFKLRSDFVRLVNTGVKKIECLLKKCK